MATSSAPTVFRVSFYKEIPDSTGHCHNCCQGVLEVHAADEQEAIKTASRRFAELTQTTVWTLRADRVKAEPLPGRKRVSPHVWFESRATAG